MNGFCSDYSGNNTRTSANMFWSDDVILQRGLVTSEFRFDYYQSSHRHDRCYYYYDRTLYIVEILVSTDGTGVFKTFYGYFYSFIGKTEQKYKKYTVYKILGFVEV